MAGTKIDQCAIEKHVKEINKAYGRAFKKYPITVPLGSKSFAASAGATGLGVGIEQDPELVRYLIWLGELPGSRFGEQADYAEHSGTPLEDVAVLAAELERDGLIDSMGSFGSPDSYRITSDGRVELRRVLILFLTTCGSGLLRCCHLLLNGATVTPEGRVFPTGRHSSASCTCCGPVSPGATPPRRPWAARG